MRPDIEDYEELTAGEEAPRSRAMSWLVLVVAVGGFAALAYYAYHSGTAGTENGEVLVVQADETPIKQIPTDPEGEQFANKDKTIYDVITPGSAANSGQGKVEKLLPDPEQPVSVRDMADEDSTNNPEAKAATNSTTTYVNKSLEKATPAVDPVDAQAAKQPAQTIAPLVSNSAPVQTAAPTSEISSTELKPAVEAKPVTETKATTVATVKGAPTFVNESAAGTKKPEAKKATPAKTEAKTEAKKAAPAASGSAAIQLGAFKTEEEANSTWKKISGKFSDVLTGSPTIVKADLPNGTFYRLRTTVASAKDACAKLSAKGQACFPVK